MKRLISFAAAATTAALLAPAAAGAAEVRVVTTTPMCTGGDECRYFMEQPYDTVTLVADPGEANRITARRGPEGFTFRDDAAPIRITSNCTRVSDNEVRCGARFGGVEAGDGDDLLTVDGVTARGGAGNDEIVDGDLGGGLNGGDGNDVIRAGGGSDTIVDDDGAAGDKDTYDFGPGAGTIDYSQATTAVSVDLRDPGAPQGQAGEDDRVTGANGADGGAGSDNLRGGDAGSSLSGAAGDDTLIGGEGNDALYGGTGTNTMAGGAGNDTLAGRYGGLNRLDCGDGVDLVLEPGSSDLFEADCEKVDFLDLLEATTFALSSVRSPVIRVDRFGCSSAGRPRVDLRVARVYRTRGLPKAGTVIGSRRASRRACRRGLTVRLNRTGQKLLERSGRLPVEVRLGDPGDPKRFVMEVLAPQTAAPL